MSENEWIARFSARLHAQWPRIGREQRDEVARELLMESDWRTLEPEATAVDWLQRGIPVALHP